MDTVIDAVVRPEDVEITKAGSGSLQGEVISCDFKGIFYVTAVKTERAEIEIHNLKSFRAGDKVGLNVAPDSIHIIPYDTSLNHYEGTIERFVPGKGFDVAFEDFTLTEVPAKQIFGNCTEKEDGLVDEKGGVISWENRKVIASFLPENAVLSDDAEAGFVAGDIFNFIFMDNYYRYRVRSESEEDYIVNDEYLWNRGDHVSVSVPLEKFKFELA